MKKKNTRRWPLIVLGVVVFVAVFWLYINKANAPTTKIGQTKTANTKSKKVASTMPAPEFDKNQYSLTDPTSIWVVVNKINPLRPKDYAPSDLTSVGNGQYMRKAAANALTKMFAAASAQGKPMSALSGYRSYQTQISVYGNEVKNYGQKVADSESARPGYSEHQTGLAVDLGGGGCGIEDCFGSTSQGKWVAANAYKYGFLVRYTTEKQSVTGYRAEPWHVRYIGTKLATRMHQQGVTTLEEFFGLPAAPSY